MAKSNEKYQQKYFDKYRPNYRNRMLTLSINKETLLKFHEKANELSINKSKLIEMMILQWMEKMDKMEKLEEQGLL